MGHEEALMWARAAGWGLLAAAGLAAAMLWARARGYKEGYEDGLEDGLDLARAAAGGRETEKRRKR